MKMKMRPWYALASVLVVLGICTGIGGYFWLKSFSAAPESVPHAQTALAKPTISPTVQPTLNMATARLLIPKIGVDASVESLGIASDGTLAVPSRDPWVDVGWYQKGPVPGQHGNAVIDGHLDRPGGAPAVFWRLNELAPGDRIQIKDANGRSLQFRVTKVASYPPTNAPLRQIFGNAAGTFLNLITCAGEWIPAQHQTSLRLVVYTVLA